MFFSFLFLLQTFSNYLPEVVGVPPSDGGRGLVRVNSNEIRHYSGGKGEKGRNILVSRDNGKTWEMTTLPSSYPPNFGGITKESPSIVQNPITREYIRVQPIHGYIFISKGGIDGQWGAVTKDGNLCFDWSTNDGSNYISLSGIMRTPTFVNGGKRILIPAHGPNSYVHISDDGGLTWTISKNTISTPAHEIGGVHKGKRWQNLGVEGTIVELKDGRLWNIVRTSQDQYWESFSKDFGNTWTPAQPSRFWGTLTMPNLHRLEDGRLLMLWTNSTPLPENQLANRVNGEDAFTNRDAHHAAISEDDGKTWLGFREIILDEHRNSSQYATFNGAQDRGKHQSQVVQLDKNKILISLGQHQEHRRLVIFDVRLLYQNKREDFFEYGLKDWTIHSYIPITKGHCAYDRKPSSSLINYKGKKSLWIRRVMDNDLINQEYGVNYEKGGASWNFPNGTKGTLTIQFEMNEGSGGTQLSLTDRLFNACDETVEKFAIYTISLIPGMQLGNQILNAGKTYTLTFKWTGVEKNTPNCKVFLNNSTNPIGEIPLINPSPNGVSYIHLISLSEYPDDGILIHGIETKVNGESLSNLPGPFQTLNLFILTGQSNSLGIIKDEEPLALPLNSENQKIKFYWIDRDPKSNIVSTSKGKIDHLKVQMFDNGSNEGHWGLEMSCARDLYNSGISNLMFIKVSRGGGGSSLWSKSSQDNHMYQAIIDAVKDAAKLLQDEQSLFKIRGLLYLQGESDGNEAHFADERAKDLLSNLKKDLPNAEEMKMFIGGIAGFSNNQILVREKHESLAHSDPNIFFIKTDDLLESNLYKDRLHFNNKAKEIIGKRFARSILSNIHID
jgi:hypothetical protein